MNCYLLDALLKTKWRAHGEVSTLRFYPAVDAGGPRCTLANPPQPDGTPDPIRSMTVNISNGAILYDCGAMTFTRHPGEPVHAGSVLGVLALVAVDPNIIDPLEDWALVTGDRIIDVSCPGGTTAQMIPADMFCRAFGSDRDTDPDHYQPVYGATAATRQFPVVLDGRDGPRHVMRGHLDWSWSEGLPEEAAEAARDPARMVGRADLFDEERVGGSAPAAVRAAPERAPSAAAARWARLTGGGAAPLTLPPAPPAPSNAVPVTVHTGGLTDRLAGMYPYYVLGSLIGTQWDGTPETKDDGFMWRPNIEVFFEPRFRDDGSMVYPVNRAAVSMIEPGISVNVFADHVEINGPGFVQATSYWDLPESNRAPVGVVILWNRNWNENPNVPSPLYLAYPVYNIGELEIDGEIVPMIPAEELESCFRPWGTGVRELSFGDLTPAGSNGAPVCPLYLARLAGRGILVQAPMCPDDPEDPEGLPHRVRLTDPESAKLVGDALRENPLLVTMGRRPPVLGRVPGPATPAEPGAHAAMGPGGDDGAAIRPARTADGGTPPAADVSLRSLVDALAGNLRAIAGALEELKRALPAED